MLQLASPLALWLLPLPLLVWYLLPQAKIYLPAALRVPFFNAMRKIVNKENRIAASLWAYHMQALIWIILVIALAGPQWIGEPRAITREGHNIMMVMDLSGSMEIADMMFQGRPASRLSVVKHAAEQFVAARSGDKIGLILFGTRAYLQTPLTYDRHSVLLRLEDATAGLAGKTTSIGDAVGLAVKRLDGVPKKGRVIILLTDGANNSGVLLPLNAATLAQEEKIKIYTIGLGSDADPQILDNDFLMSGAELDEDSLKRMADMTGGQYFRATDTETLHKIYQKINQLETITQEQATIRPQISYSPWCVALALLLFFYWLASKLNGVRLW